MNNTNTQLPTWAAATSPRPPAREDGQSLSYSPRRIHTNMQSPRRRNHNNKTSLLRKIKKTPIQDYKSQSKNKRRLTGGLDGDSRNHHFLTEMLSVVGGLSHIDEAAPPQTLFANTIQSDPTGMLSILAEQKVSPRTGKPFQREETLMLQQILGQLVQRSRQAVNTMNKTLHRQAMNVRPMSKTKLVQVPPSIPRKRMLTVEEGIPTFSNSSPRKNRNRKQRRAGSRISDLESMRQRPGSAASMSILDTAIAVSVEGRAWDCVLSEICRQVHNDCKERGALLNFVRLRYKQTSDLLVTLCKTQQVLLNAFQQRREHLRPRTRTVEKAYRKKKREQNIDRLTDKISEHKLKLEKARTRIQRLSNELVGGSGDDFEAAIAERKAKQVYNESKQTFQVLLSDLSRIEREGNRFRKNLIADDSDGKAAREAMEQHRSFVHARIKEQEELVKTSLLVQAHWRGYRSRKTDVVAARLAYTQRMVQQEAERVERLKDACKLKVARWTYKMYQIWDMKCKLNGILADDREKRRKEAAKHRHKHHVAKKHTWYDFLNAANIIQRQFRLWLWTQDHWRKRWMLKVKKQAEETLLTQVSDEGQRDQMRRTIALSLQEQENQFFTRLRVLRDQIEYLERKNCKAEATAQAHFESATLKVVESQQAAIKVIGDNDKKCQDQIRKKDLELHRLAHELETTKVQHLSNARLKADTEIENQAAYAINTFYTSMDTLQRALGEMLQTFERDNGIAGRRSATKSRQDTILSDLSGQGDIQLAPMNSKDDAEVNTMSQAFEQLTLAKHQSRLLAAMGELKKNSASIGDLFRAQDHESKVLVARINELEKELHIFDPGHDGIHHHDTNHRSHHLKQLRDHHHLHHDYHQKHHHIGHDDDKSFTLAAFDLEKEKPHRRSIASFASRVTRANSMIAPPSTNLPLTLPVQENGELDLDAHIATSRRRPSVLRPHKTIGLF